MSSDRKVSELLSKSFHGQLNADEQKALSDSMAENDETANFARISRIIQDSVTDVVVAAESGDPTIAPSLTKEAKDRLRDSVAKAQHDSVMGTMAADIDGLPPMVESVQPGDRRDSHTRFTLLRKIGEGGLGTVWLARDEHLKRTVAIKEIQIDKSASPKHMQRFLREATITGLPGTSERRSPCTCTGTTRKPALRFTPCGSWANRRWPTPLRNTMPDVSPDTPSRLICTGC